MGMDIYIWFVIVLAAVLFSLIPVRTLRKSTSVFTFKKFGIRGKKRWNALVDDLGNIFLLISFLFCCTYWLIPYYLEIYAVWMLFTLLCTISRCVIITARYPKDWKGKAGTLIVNTGTFLIGAIGLACAIGCFNHSMFTGQVANFARDLEAGKIASYMYFLTNPSFFYVLLEGILLFMPLMFLWNGFKYMRTERTIRAANVVTYAIKLLLLYTIMIGLGYEGFHFINMVYHTELEQI